MNDHSGSDRPSTVPRPHVVAVSGSRREGSYTRRALLEALSGVEVAGGTAELLDLADLNVPAFVPDFDGVSDGWTVSRSVRKADAVILGTPTYHGSYSGALKNALDHCGFDEFEDTTVGLLAVSGGPFPTAALDHLRAVCRSLHAWVLPFQAAIPRANAAFDDDGLSDDTLRDRTRTLGSKVVRYANVEPAGVRPSPSPEA